MARSKTPKSKTKKRWCGRLTLEAYQWANEVAGNNSSMACAINAMILDHKMRRRACELTPNVASHVAISTKVQ